MHLKTPRTRQARQTPECTSGAAIEIGSLVTVAALKTGELQKFKLYPRLSPVSDTMKCRRGRRWGKLFLGAGLESLFMWKRPREQCAIKS